MKRIISLMLSLIIILSLVCVAAPSASASSAMRASDSCINMIKSFEGFAKYPFEDNGQWTVGYGTRVTGDALAHYKLYGITDEQATKLLKEFVASFENSVNFFIDKTGVKLSQHQFDALLSFTYNCGDAWTTNSSSVMYKAVANGATGNDFIYAMTHFTKSAGKVVPGLVTRRLAEANMYLNGMYSKTPPSNYKYVTYETVLEDVIPSVSVQGYDVNKAATVNATASKSGYHFLGWYTKEEGGKPVTALDSSTASLKSLYAHWQNGTGELNADGSPKGVSAEYSGYLPLGGDTNVYVAPGGAVKETIKIDTKLNIVAEYVDSSNAKWGKLKDGGWVKLGTGLGANPAYEKPESVIEPITVTVISANVNKRMGPDTKYASLGKFTKGQQLVLTAVQEGGNYTWGKSEQGWICLKYTDYDTVTMKDDPNANKVTATGVIIKADRVNIRSGPGVNNAKVGSYNRGDQIKITLRQKVGVTTWGLTDKGWVSLYYVQVTEVAEGTEPDIIVPGTGTGTGTGSEVGGNTVVRTGKIVNCTSLRIRAAAGTSNPHVGDYPAGTYVNIYETVVVKNDTWGRTEKGWISLRYVALDAATSGNGVTGRIINCTKVNVRAGAGTNYAKVGSLAKGTKVEILEYTKVNNATWGRTSQGWVHLHYVQLDAPVTNLDNKVVVPEISDTSVPTVTEPTVTEPGVAKYPISVATSTNGTIAASAASAAEGAEVTLTATPNAGYALDKVTVKTASGVEVTVTGNKFTMPASNITVSATFKVQYNVKINAAEGGKVTANITACKPETEIILTAAPDAGYELDKLSVLNVSTNALVAVSGGKFTMPESDVNVVATFKKTTAKTFAVNINAATNGQITASTTTAKADDTVTLTVAPADDFVLDTLTVKDASNNVITCKAVSGKENTYSFKMPAANVTVAATFKAATYAVSITNTTPEKGTVSVNPGAYEKGATVTLVVTPASGQHEVKTLTIKAGDTVITPTKDGNNYKFTMPGKAVTVESSFGKIRYALNIEQTTGGTVTADKETYAMNETVTLTIKPATGYSRGTMIVKNGDKEIEPARSGLVFTFKMPNAPVDVKHVFTKNEYALSITNNSYGAIKADKEKYGYQDTVTLTVEPKAGYTLNAIAAKDGSTKLQLTKVGDKYTFVMPASDSVVVAATYKMIPVDYKVTNSGMTLNIRKSADVTSELLGEIPDKTVLSVLDINKNWAKIEYKGISGWVCMDYLTKVAN